MSRAHFWISFTLLDVTTTPHPLPKSLLPCRLAYISLLFQDPIFNLFPNCTTVKHFIPALSYSMVDYITARAIAPHDFLSIASISKFSTLPLHTPYQLVYRSCCAYLNNESSRCSAHKYSSTSCWNFHTHGTVCDATHLSSNCSNYWLSTSLSCRCATLTNSSQFFK